jgi:tryptophanyl-tRNA synthetase
VTDTGVQPVGVMSAGVKNLFELLRACKHQSVYDTLMEDYHTNTLKYSALKDAVADALIDLTTPFKEKLAELNADKRRIKSMVIDSSAQTRKIAQQTLKEVRELTGLMPLK